MLFPGRPPELCRRDRPRPEPEAARPASRTPTSCSSPAGGCREMPSQGYTLFDIPDAAPDARACPSRTPRSSAGSTTPRSPSTRRRRPSPRRWRRCSRPTRSPWATQTRRRARTTSPGPSSRPSIPGTFQYGEVMAWLRNRLPDDAIVTNGAGNYAIWVQPLPALPPLRHAARADLGLDGLRPAGGGRRQAAVSRTARSSASPATAAS